MEIVSPTRGSRFPNARLGLLITGLIVFACALLGLRSVDWFLLKKSLRHKFTKIEWISTSELADWLASKVATPRHTGVTNQVSVKPESR